MSLGMMDSMWAQGALHGPIATSSIGDFVFFKLIFDYLLSGFGTDDKLEEVE